MDRLKGKRALITGGSSGIGLETARQFIAEGARVAITARAASGLDQARQQLGDGAVYLVSDASDAAGQRNLAGEIKDQFGSLDVLVINAGIADLRPVEQWDESGFDRTIAINLRGPFFSFRRCCRSSRIRHRLS